MSYEARDIGINAKGKFELIEGVDNIALKVDKFFTPKLRVFLGEKSSSRFFGGVAIAKIVDAMKGQYMDLQDRATNFSLYEDEDTVQVIDKVEVQQSADDPTRWEFSFRIQLEDNALSFEGEV